MKWLVAVIRELWVELEMRKIVPSKVGRYRVIDMLQQWEDHIGL